MCAGILMDFQQYETDVIQKFGFFFLAALRLVD